MKSSKTKNIIIICAAAIMSGLFTSCSTGSDFEKDTTVKYTIDLSGETSQINQFTLVNDENNPMNLYCRIDSTKVYGFGVNQALPDTLKDCGLRVLISGKMRESESITGSIAVSLYTYKDSLLVWGAAKSSDYIKAPNVWVDFVDTFYIYKNQNTNMTKNLKVFPTKMIGRGTFDVDNLKVEITKEKL